MGKGSRPRPFGVDHEQFANSWDQIFGKKDQKEEKKSDRKDPESHQNKKTK